MGDRVDAENDGLASPLADGDDNDGTANDEDGLTDPATDLALTTGRIPTVNVRVTNTTGREATLFGWIDYNGDNVFDNATERASAPVPDGTINHVVTLSFPPVPVGSATDTFARFRLSTHDGAANATGLASDGEVEDCPVTIAEAQTNPTISGRKFHDRNGDGERDTGEEYLNGWTIELRDAQGELIITDTTRDIDLDGSGDIDPETEAGWYEFAGIEPEDYVVGEVLQFGWVQTAPQGTHSVQVVGTAPITGFDFGNAVLGSIHGQKWHDQDAGGLRGPEEPGLDGVEVRLRDLNTAEIVDMNLTGHGASTLGRVNVFAGDGTANLAQDDDLYCRAGVTQWPDPETADSFVYMFIEVDLPDDGLYLHDTQPLEMWDSIDQLVPYNNLYELAVWPISLYDDSGEEQARINDIVYAPLYGPEYGNALLDFGDAPLASQSEFTSDYPTLLAGDGEVEDFPVTIAAQPTCSLVVTHTANSGVGSLSEAINCSNNRPGLDTISFNIPANDPRHFYYQDDGAPGQVMVANIAVTAVADDSTIVDIDPDHPHSWWSLQPDLPLLELTDAAIVDGFTQPGATPNTAADGSNAVLRVELDGSTLASPIGLIMGAGNSTVRGLVINGFIFPGIWISTAGGNTVEGNYVGTDVSGTVDLGNEVGIYVESVPNNMIGGTTPQARNLISGNREAGVYLWNPGATGNAVRGNLIGTDASGTEALGNGSVGIWIVDASNNTVGGSEAGARNVISGNSGPGISVFGGTANAFVENQIFANAGLGIDLVGGTEDANGVTANDDQDPDAGANNLQNFPVFTSATTDLVTVVDGTLNSLPDETFRIEFFANQAPDPSGHGEGRQYLGSTDVTTDANGDVTITFTPPANVAPGMFVAATATRLDANLDPVETSEFSAAIQVIAFVPRVDLELEKTVDNPGAQLGKQVTFTITLTNQAPVGGGFTPVDATNIEVLDVVPAGLSGVTVTPAAGTIYSQASGVWSIPFLAFAPGSNMVQLTITGTVAVQGAVITNTAEVVAVGQIDVDSIPGNNDPAEDDQDSASVGVGSAFGFVWADVNDNGLKEPWELGLPNVPITITGPVTRTVTTAEDGSYAFVDVPAGVYAISEEQPLAFNDGIDTQGTPPLGQVENDRFVDVTLSADTVLENYNFGERGLIGELITSRMWLNHAPSQAQFLTELDVMEAEWYVFQAAANGTFKAHAEGEGVVLELYTADLMPVFIGAVGELIAPVAEGESYVLHVVGDAQTVSVSMSIEEIIRQYRTNPDNALDMTGDGYVSPLDVLAIVSELSRIGSLATSATEYFCDVTGDGQATPLDVLTVISHLNTGPSGSAAGEPVVGRIGNPSYQDVGWAEPAKAHENTLAVSRDARFSEWTAQSGGPAYLGPPYHALLWRGLPTTPPTGPQVSTQVASGAIGRSAPSADSIRHSLTYDEVSPVLAELDSILPSIIEDVGNAWEQFGSS